MIFLTSSLQSLEDSSLRRIQAHFLIEDFESAKEEAQFYLSQDRQSHAMHELYIKSLARLGEENSMLDAWQEYSKLFPEKKENRQVLEEMSWGVLNKARGSSSLMIRLTSLLGAFFSQDSRGVEILKQTLNDPSAILRATAVELSSSFRDNKLKNAVIRLFREERSWLVRKEVLKALGGMKIKELSSELENIIGSDQSMAEEKALAITALISLMDEIKRDKIEKLVNSNRAGLRLLACKAIAYFRTERDLDCLLLLSEDNHADVRAEAVQAMGVIKPRGAYKNLIIQAGKKKLYDKDPKTALSAAWLLSIYSDEESNKVFEYYLEQPSMQLKLWATSALTSTGKYGIELALKYMRMSKNNYVRLNLALSAIGQRQATEEAVEIIEQVCNEDNEKWISSEDGIFHFITSRTSVKEEKQSECSLEMENQLVRLQVLNALAVINPLRAQTAIRNFLMERTWGISGAASALLLTEGNDASVQLVKDLLQDENKKVQIQAALVLSLWSREENAIIILEKNYWHADKEMKARILEGIGRIGSMRSIPFLIETLREPSQQLRIIAATAMIQCIHH